MPFPEERVFMPPGAPRDENLHEIYVPQIEAAAIISTGARDCGKIASLSGNCRQDNDMHFLIIDRGIILSYGAEHSDL